MNPLEWLIPWFTAHARSLPWRHNPTPWAVLVSEVMLQQTQVATVLPYFERWMERFPTPQALASSCESEVLKLWEGLGYYRRARALHRAAQVISLQGELPSDEQSLLQIPGIGPYTAAAIRAFAFKLRAAPVDGNVLRVTSRLWGIEEDVSQSKVQRAIRQRLLDELPQQQPYTAAEALIELGATLCKPHPECNRCPLQKSCYAFQKGCQSSLPIKTRRRTIEPLYRTVALIGSSAGSYLVTTPRRGGLFRGLWHFPFYEQTTPELELETAHDYFQQQLGLKLQLLRPLAHFSHRFTRYQALLMPLQYHTSFELPIASCDDWRYEWVDSNQLERLTFCSGHRDIRKALS